VIAFDISSRRIEELRGHQDSTRMLTAEALAQSTAAFTDLPKDLAQADFVIVAVPTPIDENKQPDLSPLKSACGMLGQHLKKGACVVFESTVYPGTTREICGPILEQYSGLKCGKDFFLGYSPERINAGDSQHTLESVIKIVSGQDADTLNLVADVYSTVVKAGVHRAPSIEVAEAAKVIENVQRDLNIALMNELSVIFELLNINTQDVLEAAGTKWNFLRFVPGLVGGHCIGVDPYYLTFRAQQFGYHPDVILAGRRINDFMGKYIAQRLVKSLARGGRVLSKSRVGILGLTFKEDVPDIRNSRVPEIVRELESYGVEVLIADPHASALEAQHEYQVTLSDLSQLKELDAIVFAVPHKEYVSQDFSFWAKCLKSAGVFVDVKSIYAKGSLPQDLTYWAL
jgi:UDP-N-acetyl-D-galactosamine dehydrogenase